MNTLDNVINTKEESRLCLFIDTVKPLSFEPQLIKLHLMKNYDELAPYIKQLDKNDANYHENIDRIVLSHKACIKIKLQGVVV